MTDLKKKYKMRTYLENLKWLGIYYSFMGFTYFELIIIIFNIILYTMYYINQ